jgi:hypothetical protein
MRRTLEHHKEYYTVHDKLERSYKLHYYHMVYMINALLRYDTYQI